MAEALDLNIPLGEGGAESVEKIIKPLLDLEKNKTDETEKKYREISSCSSCGSFQARRMGTKYKTSSGNEYVGTLNGSGLAAGRLMIALLENNQNEDGSISIPTILKKYMNNLDKI